MERKLTNVYGQIVPTTLDRAISNELQAELDNVLPQLALYIVQEFERVSGLYEDFSVDAMQEAFDALTHFIQYKYIGGR